MWEVKRQELRRRSVRRFRAHHLFLGLVAGFGGFGCQEQAPEHEVISPSRAHQRKAQNASSIPKVSVAGDDACVDCRGDALAKSLGARDRVVFKKGELTIPSAVRKREDAPIAGDTFRWLVKFRDDLGVRLDANGSPYAQRGDEVHASRAILEQQHAGLVRAIGLSDTKLEALQDRAMRRSLRRQPDLGSLYWVQATFANTQEFIDFGRALYALDEVEFVEVEILNIPPPADIPPATDDLTGAQGYLGPNPGVDARFAWEAEVFGDGVRITDCEFAWDTGHEEFSEGVLTVESGQTLTGEYADHGTAVMGVTSAPHNGFGVDGIAPASVAFVYPEVSQEEGSRRLAAVTNAIADSEAGDIVMLEMQMTGPGGDYGPAEVTKSIWMVTKTGTDAGVVVIGAAGNGAQNLDGSAYADYRSWGDSGLIMVGAGSPDTNHSRLGFSTYGARVNVQGWGSGVATAGYGQWKKFGGDDRQSYTSSFNGTSSATPVVVGAAALIQSYAIAELGDALSPAELRTLLVDTGTPAASNANIGPLPNVRAAMEALVVPEAVEPVVEFIEPDADLLIELEDGESSRKMMVELTATDDSKVVGVQLEIDGTIVDETDEEGPYVFEVEFEEGVYELVGIATDQFENVGRSEPLKITVEAFKEDSSSSSEDDSDSSSETDSSDSDTSEDEDPDDDLDSETTPSLDEDSSTESESDDEEDDFEIPSNDDDEMSEDVDPPAQGDDGGCGCRNVQNPSAMGFLAGIFLIFGTGLRRRRR